MRARQPNAGQIGSWSLSAITNTPMLSTASAIPLDQSFLRAKFAAGGARQHDQDDGRNRETDVVDDQSEQHDAARDTMSVGRQCQPGKLAALEPQRAKRERGAEKNQQDAEHPRKVSRPHSRCRTQRVVGGDDDRGDADRDEQHSGDKVLRMADELPCAPPASWIRRLATRDPLSRDALRGRRHAGLLATGP